MKTPEQVIADTVTGTTGRHSYIVGAQAAGFIMAALDAAGLMIVPWEPTLAMYEAAEHEVAYRQEWQAMISAFQNAKSRQPEG